MDLKDANGEVAVTGTRGELKESLLGLTEDLVLNFMVYDRKGDEEWRRGTIENAVNEGVVSVQEIVQKFSEVLSTYFQDENEDG